MFYREKNTFYLKKKKKFEWQKAVKGNIQMLNMLEKTHWEEVTVLFFLTMLIFWPFFQDAL